MNNKKKKVLILIVSLFAFIMVAGGVSYAFFIYNADVAQVELSSGSISIDFQSNNNTINLSNVETISDRQGKIQSNYLDFSVIGTADVEDIMYEIEIVNSNSSLNNYLKLYLTDQSDNAITSPFLYSELYDALVSGRKGIYQDIIEGNLDGTSKTTTDNFRLRVWVDESYKVSSSSSSTVSVYLYALNKDVSNIHTLTFDFGDNRTLTKLITLGEAYGSLATPVKEGYTFTGWNGKNLFDKDNYDDEHFIVSSTGELSNQAGSNNLDDFACSDYISVKPSTNYIKSGTIGDSSQDLFDINQDLISVSSVSSGTSFTTTNDSSYVKFNLNRTNSPYSDIQFEEGSTATTYEPYYVTSNILVTQRNTNYVLKAKYEKIEDPTLTLSKITYIRVPFDNSWTYHSTTSVDGDTMTVSATTSMNQNTNLASSGYIDVNNDFWYITFDCIMNNGYSTYQNSGDIFWVSFYYNSSKQSTTALDSDTKDSFGYGGVINVWHNDKTWNSSVSAMQARNRYGPNVKYIRIYFRYNSDWSSLNYKVRDIKVYGQMSNDFYLINIDASDTEGISEIKYAKGTQTVDYFKYNGTNVADNQIKVTENGFYTVYVKGVRGNSTVSTIEITNVA